MQTSNILGLDVGTVRIGVARVNSVARIPEILGFITNDHTLGSELKKLIAEYDIDTLVVGLPRNMQGLETAQTEYVRDFCKDMLETLNLPIIMQDETLSSVTAEKQLGSAKKPYKKGDIDAQSAAVILQDYLDSQL